MICQQVFTVSSKTANHLANTYALEYISSCGAPAAPNHSGRSALSPLSLLFLLPSSSFSCLLETSSGGPDAYIMADGGWRSDKVLKSVYRHAMDDRKKEMSDIANSHFSQLCNTKKIKHRISAMFYSSERGT